jgi:hypothetical protein
MKFPIINISESYWSYDDLMEYIRFNEYFYSSNQRLFERYALNKVFCDCDGQVYQVIGKIPPTQVWRKAFKFIPNVYKEKLVFQKTGRKLELDELRDYLISRVHDLSQNDFTREWVVFLKNALSYEQVINGTIK